MKPAPIASFPESLTRFWLGTAGGVLLGAAAFGWTVFRADQPAFQCLTVGSLLAGTLTLTRMAPGRETVPMAVLLAIGFGVVRGIVAPFDRVTAGLGGVLLGLGVVFVSVLYDEMARAGIRFGKFLILGPLLGGVFLAVAPITELSQMSVFDAVRPILAQVFVGIVVGDGVGLGVELAELLPWSRVNAPQAEGKTERSPPRVVDDHELT